MAKEAVKKTGKTSAAKYGVAELAKVLKLEEPTVRIKLRKAKIKRTGREYGWNSEAELKTVAKKLAA